MSTSLVPPCSPSPVSSFKGLKGTSYLKGYPYLFVRETDQTDYFCTLCEEYLKEEALQSHLFQGHRAETFDNSFVRVSSSSPLSTKPKLTYICVVCWAKIVSPEELLNHRRSCRTDPAEEDLENGAVPMTGATKAKGEDNNTATNNNNGVASVVSTPDISNLLKGGSSNNSENDKDGSNDVVLLEQHLNKATGSKRRKKQSTPTQIMSSSTLNGVSGVVGGPGSPSGVVSGALAATLAATSSSSAAPLSSSALSAAFPQAQCLQCSLCMMVVPTQGYSVHLRDFHRVTCSLDDTLCPLCLTPVSVMELTLHMATTHGMLPQAAVNAILVWVLTSSTLPKDQQSKAKFHPAKADPSHILLNPLASAMSSMTSGLGAGALGAGALGGLGASALGSLFSSSVDHGSKLNSLLMAPPNLKMSGGTATPAAQTNGIAAAAAAAAQRGDFNGLGAGSIPTVLQSLLSKQQDSSASSLSTSNGHAPNVPASSSPSPAPNLAAVGNIVSKFTRCHYGANGKESIQCLICSKWFAVPPVKHLRGHMVTFKEEKRRIVGLIGGGQVCIICYDVFDNQQSANAHLFSKHDILVDPSLLPGGGASPSSSGLLPPPHLLDTSHHSDDIPTVIDLNGGSNSTGKGKNSNNNGVAKKVELDNAGRVKSGKVRKQCELCGEWSNIKWFFKHMSEVHQALFCRCCREYLPIHEHEEHKRWHAEPPYMGQKIRIEQGQPVIIDRKERASLTPIGSLASWGGSSGGKVVKAVDVGPSPKPSAKKRKSASANASPAKAAALSPSHSAAGPLIGHLDYGAASAKAGGGAAGGANSANKDTLMPKETCPVCGILITYKNLARHIKLRHKIKYKFCHKCRKLVPNTTYESHRNTCNEIVIDGPGPNDDEMYLNESSSDVIDPTDFLETNDADNIAAEDEDDDEALVINEDAEDGKDTFRANTSKNKLESLLGKEFKHPRRRCAICGYTVSYSNFKRHLRNAHPAQYQQCDNNEDTMDTLGHVVDEEEDNDKDEEDVGMTAEGNNVGRVAEEDDEDEETDEEEERRKKKKIADNNGFLECPKCGDHIVADFLSRHIALSHKDDEEEEEGEKEKNNGSSKSASDAEGDNVVENLPSDKNKKPISDEILKDE